MLAEFTSTLDAVKCAMEIQLAVSNLNTKLDALLIVAGANVALDRIDDAHKACREVLASNPDFTLKKYGATQPYKDPKTLEQVIGMLQKAGFK